MRRSYSKTMMHAVNSPGHNAPDCIVPVWLLSQRKKGIDAAAEKQKLGAAIARISAAKVSRMT